MKTMKGRPATQAFNGPSTWLNKKIWLKDIEPNELEY